MPLIPPLALNNGYISDFKEKASHFNNFFSLQCTPLANDSEIPENINYVTNKKLSTFLFDDDDVLKILRSLDINKAHGHDNISSRMLKICDQSIVKPLLLIFRDCLRSGIYPNSWKKSHVIPIHKKGDKQLINIYRPISLLPMCDKIFERLIYNEIFKFFESNRLIVPNQSGFRPNDSCINQLLSITHEIYAAFDSNQSLEVRGVFLDISKAFDKVWHQGLLYKLKTMGISGDLFNLLRSFLSDRYQRVLINGQSSGWEKIMAGVPQGSILGPLLFLVYINDLPNNMLSNVKIFADDTSIFSVVHDKDNSFDQLDHDLKKISEWAYRWKMSFNPDHSKQAQEVIFSRKRAEVNHSALNFNNIPVCKTSSQKHLGLILDEKLNFKEHLQVKIGKFNKGVGLLKKLHNLLPRKALLTIYKSFLRPHLDYGDIIYDQPNNESFCQKLESLQYNAALAISGAIRGTSREKLYNELGLQPLRFRRFLRKMCTLFKINFTKKPNYLYDLIPSENHLYNTRNSDMLKTYHSRTDFFKNSFFPYSITEWNKLDSSIRNIDTLAAFKSAVLNLNGGHIYPKSIFNIHNPFGIKILTRLRLGLSHLNEHRFNHNFRECINPLCSCSLEIESVLHFFLHCHNYDHLRTNLLNELRKIDITIINLSDNNLVQLLLYGNSKYDLYSNSSILNISIEFCLKSDRFSGPLL
mgnify:FL=1